MADEEFNKTHLAETFKSLVPLSIEVIKTSVYLNGGAGAALVAFLAQTTKSDPTIQSTPALGPSIRLFAGGAAIGALSFVCAYFVSWRFTMNRWVARQFTLA